MRKNIFLPILFLLIIFSSCATAEKVHISTSGMYTAGAEESLNSAKQHALEDAMRMAIEQAGVMVSSYSKTNNMVLTDDEVSIVASKIIKVIEKNFEVNLISDSEIKITAHITAEVDTDSINDDIVNLKKENKQLSKQVSEIDKKNQVLKTFNNLHNEVKERYVKDYINKYDIFTPTRKLNMSATWSDAVYNFPIHMGRKNYSSAHSDLSFIRIYYKDYKGISNEDKRARSRYIDEMIMDVAIKEIEVYLAEGESMMAIRECLWFAELLKDNNYSLDSNNYYIKKLRNYYNILRDYYDMYEPDKWEKILDKPGYPRIG